MRDEDDEPSVKDFEGANAEAEKQLSARGSDAIKAVLKVREWGCMVSARLLPMAMVGAFGSCFLWLYILAQFSLSCDVLTLKKIFDDSVEKGVCSTDCIVIIIMIP